MQSGFAHKPAPLVSLLPPHVARSGLSVLAGLEVVRHLAWGLASGEDKESLRVRLGRATASLLPHFITQIRHKASQNTRGEEKGPTSGREGQRVPTERYRPSCGHPGGLSTCCELNVSPHIRVLKPSSSRSGV